MRIPDLPPNIRPPVSDFRVIRMMIHAPEGQSSPSVHLAMEAWPYGVKFFAIKSTSDYPSTDIKLGSEEVLCGKTWRIGGQWTKEDDEALNGVDHLWCIEQVGFLYEPPKGDFVKADKAFWKLLLALEVIPAWEGGKETWFTKTFPSFYASLSKSVKEWRESTAAAVMES